MVFDDEVNDAGRYKVKQWVSALYFNQWMGNQMERIRYEPQVKAAVLAVVLDARKGGKTWAEASEPAVIDSSYHHT